MIYTGRVIEAETAYAWGLVNPCRRGRSSLKSALESAGQIADSAPMSVRMAKLSTARGQDCDSATAYALDIAAYNVLIGSEDRLEGIAAFNEKRKPVWKIVNRWIALPVRWLLRRKSELNITSLEDRLNGFRII